MKALRYLFFVLLFAGFGTTASAQLAVGGGLGYNLEAEDLGINVRGMYDIDGVWRGQAGFTFYLVEGDGFNVTEINLNGNYVFSDNGDGTKFYGLAGLNFFTVSTPSVNVFGVNLGGSSTFTGINIGAGANFGLSDNISLFGEAKYILSDFDGLGLFAGVWYHFN